MMNREYRRRLWLEGVEAGVLYRGFRNRHLRGRRVGKRLGEKLWARALGVEQSKKMVEIADYRGRGRMRRFLGGYLLVFPRK